MKDCITQEDKRIIRETLKDIKRSDRVQEMKKYIQHGKISTYQHCKSVAGLSYRIDKRLHLHSDKKTLLKGAMLHDFYLYDWHHFDDQGKLHGYHHADKALENARKYFDLNKNEEHIIWCHMWPLNLTRVPRTREAWIVCLADKVVSCKETIFERK